MARPKRWPRSGSPLGPLVWAAAAGCAAIGCQEEPEPPGPDDVVRAFVQAMSQAHGTQETGERVVELLWEPARENLKERAERASALSGRELSAAEMIAPSWFALHVVPESYASRVDGDWAEVVITGHTGQVSARCHREEGQWKVALELPALPPIRQRQGGTTGERSRR